MLSPLKQQQRVAQRFAHCPWEKESQEKGRRLAPLPSRRPSRTTAKSLRNRPLTHGQQLEAGLFQTLPWLLLTSARVYRSTTTTLTRIQLLLLCHQHLQRTLVLVLEMEPLKPREERTQCLLMINKVHLLPPPPLLLPLPPPLLLQLFLQALLHLNSVHQILSLVLHLSLLVVPFLRLHSMLSYAKLTLRPILCLSLSN